MLGNNTFCARCREQVDTEGNTEYYKCICAAHFCNQECYKQNEDYHQLVCDKEVTNRISNMLQLIANGYTVKKIWDIFNPLTLENKNLVFDPDNLMQWVGHMSGCSVCGRRIVCNEIKIVPNFSLYICDDCNNHNHGYCSVTQDLTSICTKKHIDDILPIIMLAFQIIDSHSLPEDIFTMIIRTFVQIHHVCTRY